MKKETERSILHWTSFGNGITNFTSERYDFMKKAIEEYGDEDLYIGEAMPPMTGKEGWFALRDNKKRDVSNFWSIYERISKETYND